MRLFTTMPKSTRMQTDIIISRTFVNHVGQPYSNCLSDPVDYTQNSVLQTLKNIKL